jgi:hypothetical protein
MHMVSDPTGEHVSMITAVTPVGEALWFGFVHADHIARINVEKALATSVPLWVGE